MLGEVVVIPITRWKPRTRGIKPVIAPMSKLIDCTPKRDAKALAGCRTQPFATATIPHALEGIEGRTAHQWMQYADAVMQQWVGVEYYKHNR